MINEFKQLLVLIKISITGVFPNYLIQKIQDKKLKKILISAYLNVPYYAEVMGRAGYNPQTGYKGPDDLKKIPILTKQILKSRPVTDFIHKDYHSKLKTLFSDQTSGSTGIPLTVYRSKSERLLQIAKWLRVLLYNGYSPIDKILSFTSPARLQYGSSFIQKIGLFRRLAIDYTLPPNEAIGKLCEYQPNVIYGNKSSIDLICKEITTPPKKLKLVIVTGEMITQQEKENYEKIMGARIVESYGSVELGIIAFQVGKKRLRLCKDVHYFEFVPTQINKGAEQGENLITTDLSSKIMPFIRYDLGDIVIPDNNENPIIHLKKIIGRQDDVIYLNNGEMINFLQLYEIVDKYQEIKQIRFVQRKLTHLDVIIVVSPENEKMIIDELSSELRQLTQNLCKLSFSFVDGIPLESNGKIRFVVSEIKDDGRRNIPNKLF